MLSLKRDSRKYIKVYGIAFVLVIVCSLIGSISFDIGIGQLVFPPIVFATIFGGLLGPDLLKVVNTEESKLGGNLVMIALAPFLVKIGISAGSNLSMLKDVGPALILQEFGNLGTIFLSMPVALLLGLKEEAIGACYSINRDSNFGVTTGIYGADAPETKGTFAVFVIGSVIGPTFISLLVSIVASWNIFHPLALGMASGVGAGIILSASVGTLGTIYPQYAAEIAAIGSASEMLTGTTGIYMSTFIALPVARKLYQILEPKIGRSREKKEASIDVR